MKELFKPSLNWLLILLPVTAALEFFAPHSGTWIFLTAAGAIIPLAAWLGKATEHLATRTTESIGGLLNATFGNATELIIAAMALHRGLTDMVKASLTGSIIGNILLVLGAAILAGGWKHEAQRFNATAARVRATMLTLAAIALVMPALYHHLAGPGRMAAERDLSLEISVILLLTYALGLFFSLHTHKQYFSAGAGKPAEGHAHARVWSVRKALLVLGASTALIGWMSEVLVGSVETAAHSLGMTDLFVGVVVVAIIGNAAEHASAITAAMANRMELSVEIAVGSSIQIALFVAPLLVLLSYLLGPAPMDLVFTPAEVVAVGLAVLITEQISGDGESNWLEGIQLVAVYLVLALVFYFLPETGPAPQVGRP
ncbi:MAG: calcium/proton exchanger [Bryobacterales bacterium]|nr:calcium/proton exchanger [Bryobacterales bacterium]